MGELRVSGCVASAGSLLRHWFRIRESSLPSADRRCPVFLVTPSPQTSAVAELDEVSLLWSGRRRKGSRRCLCDFRTRGASEKPPELFIAGRKRLVTVTRSHSRTPRTGCTRLAASKQNHGICNETVAVSSRTWKLRTHIVVSPALTPGASRIREFRTNQIRNTDR